jgi:hypothetical protein
MRIRIIKKPEGTTNGIHLEDYRAGKVYNIGAGLAEYLVAEGYAIVEMRDEESHSVPKRERRRN